MSSIVETLRNLKRLADPEHGAPEEERKAAARAYQRLLAIHQVRRELLEDPPAEIERDVRFKTPAQRELLVNIGLCLGLSVYTLTTVRKLKRLRFKGDPAVVELAIDLFKRHQAAFDRRVELYAAGLAHAMFPSRVPEATGDTPKYTEEEYAAARAGMQQGKRVAVRPELQNVLGS